MSKRAAKITYISNMIDTDEHIKTEASGTYMVKDGLHYLMYTEGEGKDSVRNILKFNNNSLHISKIGITRTEMHYEKDYKHVGIYNTPFGQYEMNISTEDYVFMLTKYGFNIRVKYDLELGGSFVSKCIVEILIELENNI